jgi:class 3 adenylate cyclase/tetratricopeptide (TPR) repeat protein
MSDPTPAITCPSCGAANLPGSRFCSTCATPLATAPAPAESRKTVTILFCDATSSTALGERLDPESIRGLMTRYFAVMREVIEFHGGALEKFIGDAVMAVFGVPAVHEDDALRACRAAVEIRDRLAELDARIREEQGATIQWRMGINTGVVVAGDVARGQRIVTGDAVNVAARLEAAASPGETLIGPETYPLVRDQATTEAVEPLSLKGKAEPVPAWRLLAVEAEPHRRPRPMEAPLVGRKRPLRLLDEGFREATEERVCHLFTVLGVAGVGKSRLVEEFIGSVGDQAQVAMGRCLAYGHGITYWPVAEAIRDGLGLGEDDPPDTTMARLHELLEAEPDAERISTIVGGLLVIADSPSTADETFWAIRKTFEAMARRTPLILVFDDIHWGEPTFLDLVDHIADWTRDAPILLIAMARPELLEKRPSWGGGKRWVTTISLEPLSEVESEELAASLLGRADLPAELRHQIASAAEGNPLFVEELLGKLIDDGFLVPSGDGWAASGDLGALTIPSSIWALLAARLDGLAGEERAVLERAAVEGKIFHRGAVIELSPEPMRGEVRDRLASLMRMELVRPDQASFAGDEAYRFRHLLIRDAAYKALAKQTRSELHERFATWLERVAGERVAEYQDIVGYHLEQAYRYRVELGPPDAHAKELGARAGRLLVDAGQRARRRGDISATVDLLERAIELLPEEEARQRRLRFSLAITLYDRQDGPRAEAVLAQAIAEADAAADEGAGALAALGLVAVQGSTRAIEGSISLREYERLGRILERTGDVDGARLAEAWAAFALFSQGRAGEAAERSRAVTELGPSADLWYGEAAGQLAGSLTWGPTPIVEALDAIRALRDRAPEGAFGMMGERAIVLLEAFRGRLAEAHETARRARARLEELGNRHQLTWLLNFEGLLAQLEGDLEGALRMKVEAYETMTASGDRAFASTMAVDAGAVLLELDDPEAAWRYGTIAVETSSSDDVMSQGPGRAIQARVLSRRGEHDAAESLAREAVAIMARTDYLTAHGDVVVHLAHVLREAGKTEEAITAAREAVALYAEKGATALVDRTEKLIAEWSA